MSLFIATVEAWDAAGNGDYYEVAVIADTQRGAARRASAELTKRGFTGAATRETRQLDVYATKVVLVAKKEAADADRLGG